MKNLTLVCVALVLAVSVAVPAHAAEEESPFTLAQRVGEPPRLIFHMFSTSVGKYTIRQDGLGEVYVGKWRKEFQLKTGAKARIMRVYFYEYEGDLLLLYDTGATGYLVRLDQKTRAAKRVAAVNRDFNPPVIREKSAVFDDGTVVPLS